MAVYLCLSFRVKELRRAREHETPEKSPLAMWHHSPDSSLIFVCTPDILQRNGKKHQYKHCNYYYYCGVSGSTTATCTTAFFHISILSTDLILVGEWRLLTGLITKKGWGGGCRTLASWHFLHFFMDCFFVFFETRRGFKQGGKRTQDTSYRRTYTEAAAEDLRG